MFASNIYSSFQLLANNSNPYQGFTAFSRKQPPLIPLPPPPAAEEVADDAPTNHNEVSQSSVMPNMPEAKYMNLLNSMDVSRANASHMEAMLDMPRYDLAALEAQRRDLSMMEAKRYENAILEASRMKTLESYNAVPEPEKEDITEELFAISEPIAQRHDSTGTPPDSAVSRSSKKITSNKGPKLNRKIVKNFGKAIASFACSEKALAIIEKTTQYRTSSRKKFITFVYDHKECIEGNRRFRQLLTVCDEDSEDIVENKIIFKRIANIFMKSYVHQWIWNSKIMNKDLHAQLVSEMKKRINNPMLLESLSS